MKEKKRPAPKKTATKKIARHTPAAIAKFNPEFHRLQTSSLAEGEEDEAVIGGDIDQAVAGEVLQHALAGAIVR